MLPRLGANLVELGGVRSNAATILTTNKRLHSYANVLQLADGLSTNGRTFVMRSVAGTVVAFALRGSASYSVAEESDVAQFRSMHSRTYVPSVHVASGV
jgi:hypothetical protein